MQFFLKYTTVLNFAFLHLVFLNFSKNFLFSYFAECVTSPCEDCSNDITTKTVVVKDSSYQSEEDASTTEGGSIFTFSYASTHTPVVTDITPRVITNQNTLFNIIGHNLGRNISELAVTFGSNQCNLLSLAHQQVEQVDNTSLYNNNENNNNSTLLQCMTGIVEAGVYELTVRRASMGWGHIGPKVQPV